MQDEVKKAKFLATLLDAQFKIGEVRFGLDPILSAVPVVGNLIGVGISFYVVGIGMRHRISFFDQMRMIGNIILDFLAGLIPVIGVIFDIGVKANLKNIKILEGYLEKAHFKERVIEGKIIS